MNGAVMAIVDDAKYIVDGKTVLVKDSLTALKSIGNYAKTRANPKLLVGITGSVGKTTTKQWLSSVLSKRFNVVSSAGNYNTIYGMPICLAGLDDSSDYGVFEIGSNNPGEVSELSTYLNPDIGVITAICEAHIGKFGTMADIAREKISIMDGIKDGGAVVYDGDLERASEIRTRASLRNAHCISVGFGSNCDFYVKAQHGNNINLHTPIGPIEYQISAAGKHFAYISACVIAIMYAMKINPMDFLEYFGDLTPVVGRGVMERCCMNGIEFALIDDSYNANPTSVMAALDTLDALESPSKIVVLGQMRELGDYTMSYHKLIAEKLYSMLLQQIFFIGDRLLFDIMRSAGPTVCFETTDDMAARAVIQSIQRNSVVLLKGSRSASLERIISRIHRYCMG
jgi:UDP-N-acetylmuramoyl-tripeptide--D-alanyl-D-alanine ligase